MCVCVGACVRAFVCACVHATICTGMKKQLNNQGVMLPSHPKLLLGWCLFKPYVAVNMLLNM